jgi:hypothetical protein
MSTAPLRPIAAIFARARARDSKTEAMVGECRCQDRRLRVTIDSRSRFDMIAFRWRDKRLGGDQMAYLGPQFALDVFVSYSHGDPRGVGDSPLKQWTIKLVRELEGEIRSVDTEFDGLDVWCDELIDPTLHLTPELRAKVRTSGVLMIMMSPRYLSSTWCKDELAWFRDQIAARSGDHGRVFVVRVLPTDETAWPEFLRDERGNSLVGFRFYDPRRGMPFRWRDTSENSEDYARQLWTLQTSLTRRLRELRSRAKAREAAPSAAPISAGSAQRIYLHSRDEDAGVRDKVRDELTGKGLISLTPPAGPGRTLIDWTRESKLRIEAAKRCAALALVRAHDDECFIGELLDIGIDERERIQRERGVPLPCAVLDGTGEGLPIDVSPYGIRHFDLSQAEWPTAFRSWIDEARQQAA